MQIMTKVADRTSPLVFPLQSRNNNGKASFYYSPPHCHHDICIIIQLHLFIMQNYLKRIVLEAVIGSEKSLQIKSA